MANRNDFRIDDRALRRRLLERSVTQAELAGNVLEVTPNTVQNWLNGDTRCSEEHLVLMAEHLEIGMLDLARNCPEHLTSRQSATDSAQSLVKLVEWAAGTSGRLKKWLPFGNEPYESIRAMVQSLHAVFEYYHGFIISAPWPAHGYIQSVTTQDDELHQYGRFLVRPQSEGAGRLEFARICQTTRSE